MIALGCGLAAAQDYGYAQGDVPADAAGNVYFSEPGAHSIYKVTPRGEGSVFYSGRGDSPNGLEFDPRGRLVACTRGAIIRFDMAGGIDTLAASGPGADFKDLNDITIGPDGVEWLEEKKILYVADRNAAACARPPPPS